MGQEGRGEKSDKAIVEPPTSFGGEREHASLSPQCTKRSEKKKPLPSTTEETRLFEDQDHRTLRAMRGASSTFPCP